MQLKLFASGAQVGEDMFSYSIESVYTMMF